jgi:hypothetical protein
MPRGFIHGDIFYGIDRYGFDFVIDGKIFP